MRPTAGGSKELKQSIRYIWITSSRCRILKVQRVREGWQSGGRSKANRLATSVALADSFFFLFCNSHRTKSRKFSQTIFGLISFSSRSDECEDLKTPLRRFVLVESGRPWERSGSVSERGRVERTQSGSAWWQHNLNLHARLPQ